MIMAQPRTLLLFVLMLAISSCSPIGVVSRPTSKLGAVGGSKKDPYPTCGPRDSYRFIAQDFVCSDGSNPFRGNTQAAARSRRGSIGSHLDVLPENVFESHIVDVYEVPCPDAPVEVYVCMYHCPKR